MKKLFLTLVAIAFSIIGFAQPNPNTVHVNGYYKSNGTYVQTHIRTAPNNTTSDNYSTYPNYNPYTGQTGNR